MPTNDNLSTITGIVTAESDLTNETPEPVANTQVKAIIDVEDDQFFDTYLYAGYTKGKSPSWFDFYGYVRQIAFGSMVTTATTGTDGSFTLQVPSSPQGLPIKIRTDEFALNQQLLQGSMNLAPVWGVQSVRTLFGWDMGYSDVPTKGLDWGEYQSAYVEFSAPTGAAAPQPTKDATAEAVLSPSGIISVQIKNPGEGYTQAPIVKFPVGGGFNSVQAEGTAVITGGRVSDITITSPGSGYLPNTPVTVELDESIIRKANYKPEFTFSVVKITNINKGSGYGQTAPNVTIVGTGTGATAHAVMEAKIEKINVTAPGSGYTQTPLVFLTDNFGAKTEAWASMTTENPILSLLYDGTNTTLWPASPVPTVTIGSTAVPPASLGAGATATATLSTVGQVMTTSALVGGTGYTSAPEITITGGGGFGATATATITTGSVTGITITNNGQDYTSAPTINFTGGGGSGASATAVLGFPLASISLTTGGVNYVAGFTTVTLSNGGPNVSYTNECDIKYSMAVKDVTHSADGSYSGAPTVSFVPKDGNGTGAAATAAVYWEINDIVLDNAGSGYKYENDYNVYIKIDAPATPNGVQATADAVLGNGVLSAVRAQDFGEGYTAAPHVYLLNDGGIAPVKQAELTATVAGGNVTSVTITDPGEGYDFDSYDNNDYEIVFSTYNSSAAASAEANPKSGQIDFIKITDPGAGYAVVPTVEIGYLDDDDDDYQGNANGFGSGAAATAVVTDGRVTAITVTNAGSGYYTAPDINVTVASTVITATGRCVINNGRIMDVTFAGPNYPNYFFSGGYGYEAPPTLTFHPSVTGVGSGAEGVAVVENGTVIDVIMTNQGSGYVGMNKPLGRSPEITPTWRVLATGGKSYVRDIYMGTGLRTMEQ